MKKFLFSKTKVILFFVIMANLSFGHLLFCECGVDWVMLKNSFNQWDVGYSGNSEYKIFVSVGNNGSILTSPDAINWTLRSSGVTQKLRGVSDNSQWDGLIVVVGDYGKILTSPYGINWTKRTSGTTQKLRSVAYGYPGAIFVAVGDYGTILYSTGGEYWSKAQSGVTNRLYDVCYSEESSCFVAVGGGGMILTGYDSGESWIRRSSPTIQPIRSVTCSPCLLVAVADNGKILTSPDGVNWTLRSSGVTKDLHAVTYSAEKELFVAVGHYGTFITLTSPDGINWSNKPSGIYGRLYGVAYGNSRFVAVGDISGDYKIMYSLCQ